MNVINKIIIEMLEAIYFLIFNILLTNHTQNKNKNKLDLKKESSYIFELLHKRV